MRWGILAVGVLLAGCTGPSQPVAEPPTDFTVTQFAAAHNPISESYAFEAKSRIHLNATLVWGTPGNRLEISVEPVGTNAQQDSPAETVRHLEMDLDPGHYLLRVAGVPLADDTWHLEAHFTNA